MKYLFIILIFWGCQNEVSLKTPKAQPENTVEEDKISYRVEERSQNPLYDAINTLDAEHIEETFQKHKNSIDIDQNDNSGTSPLTQFLIAAAESDIDRVPVIKNFLELGFNPNYKTSLGLSPLSIAVQNNEVEVAKILLEYGANPDEVLSDGNTLKGLAEKLQRNKILELLNQYL